MGLGTKKGKKQEKMNERKQEWEMRNERKEELVKEE